MADACGEFDRGSGLLGFGLFSEDVDLVEHMAGLLSFERKEEAG